MAEIQRGRDVILSKTGETPVGRFIVKVRVPIGGTEDMVQPLLAYNEDRNVHVWIGNPNTTEAVLAALGNEPKGYFWAEASPHLVIDASALADEQEW